MISIIITAVLGISTALLVLFGILSGKKRGMKRQLVKTATVITAALIALLISSIVSDLIIDYFTSISDIPAVLLEAMGINVGKSAAGLNTFDVRYLIAIPVAFIISPLIFLLSYVLFHFILKIPAFFIVRRLKLPKKATSTGDRFIGMAIGLVQSIIVAAIIFTPVTGLLNTVDDAFEPMYDKESDSLNDVIATYELDIQPITDNFMVNFLGAMGGNLIYDGVSTVSIGDNSYNMSDEVATPLVKIMLESENLGSLDLAKLTKEQQNSINTIIEALGESNYISGIMADVLIVYTDSLKSSEDLAADANLKEVTDATLGAIGSMAEENKGNNNLASNLSTITEVYFMLSDYDVLTSIKDGEKSPVDALLEVVEETPDGKKITVMSKAASVFNENDHTVPIVTALTKVSIASLAGSLDTDTDITLLYEDVKAGFEGITEIDRNLEKDEYVNEVAVKLEDSLINNGIELEADVIDGMAEHVYENYDEIFSSGDGDSDGTLSDYEMNNVMLSYYEVYLDYAESAE